jgi:hypothetical protein
MAKAKPKVKKIPANTNNDGCENHIVRDPAMPSTANAWSLALSSRHLGTISSNNNVTNTSVEYCFSSEE